MKDKKGQLGVGGIVILVMGIVVVLVILQAIFGYQTQVTTKTNIVNETLTKTAAISATGHINTSYWFALDGGCPQTTDNWRLTDTSDCALSGITVSLSNGTALVLNTDYVINSTGGVNHATCTDGDLYGDISFKDTLNVNKTDNATKISYTYCQDGYSTNSGSRTMAGLIGLLSAIALLVFVIYMGVRQWID